MWLFANEKELILVKRKRYSTTERERFNFKEKADQGERSVNRTRK